MLFFWVFFFWIIRIHYLLLLAVSLARFKWLAAVIGNHTRTGSPSAGMSAG